MVEAARATCAATSFFEPGTIGKRKYVYGVDLTIAVYTCLARGSIAPHVEAATQDRADVRVVSVSFIVVAELTTRVSCRPRLPVLLRSPRDLG
jgi:hypothetical protein